MRALYSTRERFPTYRVDLTELFSRQLVSKGWTITWHMRGAEPAPACHRRLNDHEDVHVGGVAASRGGLGAGLDLFAWLRHLGCLWTMVRSEAYDFVQVRDQALAGLVAALAARKAGIPFFYWMSFPYPEADLFRAADPSYPAGFAKRAFYRLRGVFTRWLLYRQVLPRANHVFVQSDRMRDDVAREGVAFERMTPVPMCIDVAQVEADAVELAGDARLHGRLPLVYLGTLVRLRRIDILLEMMALLRDADPRLVLVLVGDAPDADMRFLRSRAGELALGDRVVFVGFVPVEDAWAHVRAAAVCLSPIRPSPVLDAGSPTKVIEYLAWNKPVVANRHPDQSAVLQSSGCGVLVDFTAESFANGVLQVLNDQALVEHAARQGRAWVRDHRNYASLAHDLAEQYRTLVPSRAAAPALPPLR